MYIIKNAWTNFIRGKGRNILIGIIITVITTSACVALTIYKSGNALIKNYQTNNPVEVSFSLNPMNLRSASDEEKNAFTSLTEDDIVNYGTSNLVTDYYYTLETTLSSDTISPISYENILNTNDQNIPNDMPDHEDGKLKFNQGDFRITGYSDPSYIDTFINGTNKISSGSMFTKESTDMVAVISEELAEENNLSVGDTISFYSPDDSETIYTFTIVGIYQNNSGMDENSFLNMNAMNSSNQIYTNINSAKIVNTTSANSRLNTGLSAKFYLVSANDIENFKEEVTSKGLSSYYQIITNEEEVLATLKPIQNISHFSITFLAIILTVGVIILSVINFINIRERKYEIGVLRAIGMSKGKVTLQLVGEILIVAFLALIIGTGLGMVLSQPVTNTMLSSEIESYEAKQTNLEENFGGMNFERPGFNGGRGNGQMSFSNPAVDYVDELNVQVDLLTILELFLVSLGLTGISGMIASFVVNQYEPNKILQNRA